MLSENHEVGGREGGTVNKRRREGFRQKREISTLVTTSRSLILWDVMFSVSAILLTNELRELTSWGPPISEKLLKGKKDNGYGRKCIMSFVICFPLEEQVWLSFGFLVVPMSLLS